VVPYIENIKIEYSPDNGANWIEIVESTENDGSFIWGVPCNPTSNGVVKISNAEGDSFDVSNGVISILCAPPSGADLTATCKAFHATNFGKKINVTVNLANIGTEDVDAFMVGMYLSNNGIDLEQPPLDECYVRKGLNVDKTKDNTMRYVSEESLSGKYAVIIVDSNDVIQEIGEDNNNIIIQIP